MARILFVDDDHITLEILGKAAELLGHQPILIEKAGQVLDTACSKCPDLIVMDMMMPDINGLDVLRLLHDRPETSSIPVVILSAGSGWDDSARVKEAGAQAYLSKPVSLAELMATIKKFTTD